MVIVIQFSPLPAERFLHLSIESQHSGFLRTCGQGGGDGGKGDAEGENQISLRGDVLSTPARQIKCADSLD